MTGNAYGLLMLVLSVVLALLAVWSGVRFYRNRVRRLHPESVQQWGWKHWLAWVALALAIAALPYVIMIVIARVSPEPIDVRLTLRSVRLNLAWVAIVLGTVLLLLPYAQAWLFRKVAFARAMDLSQQGRHDETIQLLRALVAAKSPKAVHYLALGWHLAGKGQHEEALDHFRSAQRLAPLDPFPLNLQFAALEALKRDEEAKRLLESAAEQWPEDLLTMTNHALLLASTGWTREAIETSLRVEQLAARAGEASLDPYRKAGLDEMRRIIGPLRNALQEEAGPVGARRGD